MILFKKKQFYKNKQYWFPKNEFISNKLEINSFAIISKSSAYITRNQIESCRKVIVRIFRTQQFKPKLHICLHYLINKTVKSKGSRMGSGKGDFCNSISKIKKFDILFRFTNIEKVCVDNILKKIKFKLPIKVGIVVSN